MPFSPKSHRHHLFRIEFRDLNIVGGNIRNKRNIILFVHGMGKCDVIFIVHSFNIDVVIFVTLLRFLPRQSNASTRIAAGTDRRNHIATYRADIKLGLFHVAGTIFILPILTGQQLADGNTQCLRQLFQNTDIRKAFSRFP